MLDFSQGSVKVILISKHSASKCKPKVIKLTILMIKIATENEAEVTVRLSSNMTRNSKDEIDFHRNLLLTVRQVWKLRKTFVNYSSVNINISKTIISKIKQFGAFFGKIFEALTKVGVPLMKNVIKASSKIVLILLRLI